MNDSEDRSSTNRPIYIAILAALTFVIVVLLVSIPATKKKYNSNTETGDDDDPIINPGDTVLAIPGFEYTPPTIENLDEIISDGAIVRFRSIGNGETYKTDYGNIYLNEGVEYNTTGLGFTRNGNNYGFQSNSKTGLSPYFQKEKRIAENFINSVIDPYPGGFTNGGSIYPRLDQLLLKKYNTSPKPSDLSQAEYDVLIAEGWYVIPLFLAEILSLLPGNFRKSYVVGDNETLHAILVGVTRPGTLPSSIQDFEEFVFNIDPEVQADIDSALDYQNVFRFIRSYENDNAFIVEVCNRPGFSYQVSRHNFIRRFEPPNVDAEFVPAISDISERVYIDSSPVSITANTFSQGLRGVNYTDKAKVSFYIEYLFNSIV